MPSYPVSTTTLDNGLEVAVLPSESPAVTVNLWYSVGSADEDAGRTGFAHLFEHLMFEGSSQVAPGEHMALIESAGGTVNATTSADRTNYFETVPPGALELALWLEADRLASLDISEEHFAAQRDVVKEEKRERYDNQPYGDLLELLIGQHFPADHPYGHLTIGSMADLDDAELADVDAFFRRWYRPANARLVLAGAVGPEEGFALAERHLGTVPSAPARTPRSVSDVALHPPSELRVERDVPYSVSYLSWQLPPAADPAHPAIDLALSILSDGHASVLHRALVADQRVAQEAHASLLTNQHAPSLAMVLTRPSAGTSTEVAADAALETLRRFAETGPDPEAFARARAQVERDWLWQLASTTDRADAANEAWALWGDPARINTQLDEMLALTPDGVQQAVARWLAPSSAHRLHYVAGEH